MIRRTWRPPLVDRQKRHYLTNLLCPWCGGADREGDEELGIADGVITSGVYCLHCGASWKEVYRLAEIEDLPQAQLRLLPVEGADERQAQERQPATSTGRTNIRIFTARGGPEEVG